MRFATVFFALMLTTGAAAAASRPVIHSLSEAEALRWIEAARAQKTEDGATILQVLENAQRLRPSKFKFGEFDIGYNGRDGEPDAVTVETWIGSKRLPDDAIGILIPVKRNGTRLIVKIPRASGLFLTGLRKGRDTLVRAIDEVYGDVCVNAKTHAKLC